MKPKIPAQIGARRWSAKKMAGSPPDNGGARKDDVSGAVARRRGYTLIEFIGVLAIAGILASMLIPVVMSNLDSEYVAAENTNLATIQNALEYEITHTFQIPSETNWASLVSGWLMLPTANITNNGRGFNRVYVYDTNGFGTGFTLPYVQNNGLAAVPPNPRIMIVTSISTNLPVLSGGLGSNDFSAIWNTTQGTLPNAPAWANWKGAPGDLIIERINLQPLFCRVVLNAIDTNDFGSVTFQSGPLVTPLICILTNSLNLTNVVANTWNIVNGVLTNLGSTLLSGPGSSQATASSSYQAFTGWYIQGTVVNFYDTNTSPLSLNMESQLVVQSDCSYVFEDQAWRGLLSGWGTNGPGTSMVTGSSGSGGGGSTVTGQNYVNCDNNFKGCGNNPNNWYGNQRGDSCQSLSGCFHSFMMDYNNWCQEGFNTGNDSSCGKVIADYQRINNITGNMCQ